MKDSRAIGTKHENAIAKILTRWFHGGKGEKVFFRTHGSGGACGFRGDLRPPASIRVHIECKKGDIWNFSDVLKGTNTGKAGIEGWWEQATRDRTKRAKEDGEEKRPVWLIFTRARDPYYIAIASHEMLNLVMLKESTYPHRKMKLSLDGCSIVVMLLDEFLKWASPKDIKRWSR